MIPQEKSAAVTRGLRETFGVTEFEDIRQLSDGLGANPVFRIVVRGSAYLLRINLRAGDLTRQYPSMKTAAEAGVAPRVWYTSVEDRISITDFVEAAPFPAAEALVRIPATLRKLHALPPFPEAGRFNTSCTFLIHKGSAVDDFFQRFQAANILPKSECEALFARHAQVAAVYPHHDADMVSSHNDLFKPDNILYDGHRVWLVDWEAAFRNDRYADLAVVANMVVNNEAEERIYLQEYFREPPDEYQRARLFLAQQLAHMFYAMAFLTLGSSRKPIDWSETVPGFPEFQRRLWAGEIDLRDTRMKTVYGRVHWERLSRNMHEARFDEAVRIVADRHATR
ncbi:MAG TPA: phosphotransferase [Bryobacteraceae bacterium]